MARRRALKSEAEKAAWRAGYAAGYAARHQITRTPPIDRTSFTECWGCIDILVCPYSGLCPRWSASRGMTIEHDEPVTAFMAKKGDG